MPATATSVHTVQTTGIVSKFFTYRDYLASFSDVELKLSGRLYELVDETEHHRYFERFNECRTRAWFVRNTISGVVRVRSNHCGLRWCPFCSRTKSFLYSMSALPWLRERKHPKFLTLTMRHRSDPLDFQINFIYDSFRRLRRLQQFKKYVTGGLWFFQVKKSSKTGEWHPHIHAIIDGKYIPHSELKALWQSVTGDSVIVDIRAVRGVKVALDYVSRYVARPMSLRGLTDSEMLDLRYAFFRRRLCGSFGTAKGVSFSKSAASDPGEWHSVGSWLTVINLAGSDAFATAIYDCWQSGDSLPAGVDVLDVDEFICGGNHSPPINPCPDPQMLLPL